MKEASIPKKQFDLSFIHLFSYLWQTDIHIIHLVIKVAKFQKVFLIFVFFSKKKERKLSVEQLYQQLMFHFLKE